MSEGTFLSPGHGQRIDAFGFWFANRVICTKLLWGQMFRYVFKVRDRVSNKATALRVNRFTRLVSLPWTLLHANVPQKFVPQPPFLKARHVQIPSPGDVR
jgi:hypothetical protein